MIQVPTQQAGIGELLGSRRTERILIHENASFLKALQAVSLFFFFAKSFEWLAITLVGFIWQDNRLLVPFQSFVSIPPTVLCNKLLYLLFKKRGPDFYMTVPLGFEIFFVRQASVRSSCLDNTSIS